MKRSVKKLSLVDAKANLGDVLSSPNTHGPVEITIDGKSAGFVTLPPGRTADRSRISELATAYSQGLISWPQITEETGASYGELLVEMGLKNLQIPKATSQNRPAQIALFHRILDLAAADSKRKPRQLTEEHEEVLKLYSQGKMGSQEAKADLACDFRELIALLNQRGLKLPHVSLPLAEKMANEALSLMNIPVAEQTADIPDSSTIPAA